MPIILTPPNPISFKHIIFADAIEKIMKENTPDSYRYVLTLDNQIMRSGAGGEARHAIDAPELAARVSDRHNIASMSKTITAIAVLAALQRKNLTPDELIAPYFPPDWSPSAEVKQLTFRDFLTHRTGFLWDPNLNPNPNQDGTTYEEIRNIIAQHPYCPIKQDYHYRNVNFAVFRVVLPYLDSYNRFTRKVELAMPSGAKPEVVLAERYRQIVNQTVLAPSGVVEAGFHSETLTVPGSSSSALYPALAYPFHDFKSRGIDAGDRTLVSGSEGWSLSVVDIAKVLQTALLTEVILSERSRGYMLLGGENQHNGLGFDMDPSLNGSRVFSHGAYIPFGDHPTISSAAFAGWYLYFEAQQMLVVALSNCGQDPAQLNWFDRVMTAYSLVYAPGSPGQ